MLDEIHVNSAKWPRVYAIRRYGCPFCLILSGYSISSVQRGVNNINYEPIIVHDTDINLRSRKLSGNRLLDINEL